MYVNEERKHKGIECKLCRKLCSLFFFFGCLCCYREEKGLSTEIRRTRTLEVS